MKRPGPLLRRCLALISTAVAAGLAGCVTTIALATPAQAEDDVAEFAISPGGPIECRADGSQVAAWTLTNETDADAYVVGVEPVPPESSTDLADPLVPGGESVQIVQVVPPGSTAASIAVNLSDAPEGDPLTAVASPALEGLESCLAPARLGAEFSAQCDGTTTVKLINEADMTVEFRVNGEPVSAKGEKSVPNVAADPDGSILIEAVAAGDDLVEVASFRWKSPGDCVPLAELPATGPDLSAPVHIGTALLVTGIALLVASAVLRRWRVEADV